MAVVEALKVGALLFVAAIVQASILSPIDALGGRPDLLLVTLVGIALLRGSIVGAAGGFFAGLVLDTATLETLGLTSLLLTTLGYWIGRYGETTGRPALRPHEQGAHGAGAASPSRRLSAHAPFVSVAVVTVLYAFGALLLHFVLGEHAPARLILLHRLPAAILFNLLLTLPVYALCRRALRSLAAERVSEVQLLG